MIKVKDITDSTLYKITTMWGSPVEEQTKLNSSVRVVTTYGNTAPLFIYESTLEQLLIEHNKKTEFDGVYYIEAYGITWLNANEVKVSPIGVNYVKVEVVDGVVRKV